MQMLAGSVAAEKNFFAFWDTFFKGRHGYSYIVNFCLTGRTLSNLNEPL